MDNNIRKSTILLRYLLAFDLSFETSIIKSVSYPKSKNIEKSAINAVTKAYSPKVTSPKRRAIKIDNITVKIEVTTLLINKKDMFFGMLFDGLIESIPESLLYLRFPLF